jgi:hypothetical protein
VETLSALGGDLPFLGLKMEGGTRLRPHQRRTNQLLPEVVEAIWLGARRHRDVGVNDQH